MSFMQSLYLQILLNSSPCMVGHKVLLEVAVVVHMVERHMVQLVPLAVPLEVEVEAMVVRMVGHMVLLVVALVVRMVGHKVLLVVALVEHMVVHMVLLVPLAWALALLVHRVGHKERPLSLEVVEALEQEGFG